MKNVEYIKKQMEQNIKYADKHIKKCYDELKQVEKLPLDCTGVVIDGMVCENPQLKIDSVGNYQHQIGYLECLKNQSKEILNILNMDDNDFDKFEKRQKHIEKQNAKTMKELKDKIFKKLKQKNE